MYNYDNIPSLEHLINDSHTQYNNNNNKLRIFDSNGYYFFSLCTGRTPISEGSHCVTPTPSRSKIHKRNMRGETPLHIACIKGNMTAVTNLLDQGAHIDAKDNAGI